MTLCVNYIKHNLRTKKKKTASAMLHINCNITSKKKGINYELCIKFYVLRCVLHTAHNHPKKKKIKLVPESIDIIGKNRTNDWSKSRTTSEVHIQHTRKKS